MRHIQEFIETIADLRAPGGCPWDRQQDHGSLAGYLLEETHEVLSAIRAGDPDALKEELGDLLLQIVLHCQIAKEQGHFDFEDVAKSINAKMIERHPHVFGEEVSATTAKQVLGQWHVRKAQADKAAGAVSVIGGVPDTMPALLQSLKVSQKAAAGGFEWDDEAQVWQQLESELHELKEAMRAHKDLEASSPDQVRALKHETALELGDVLFCLVNVARWEDLNPEEALLLSLNKFKTRFHSMEKLSDRAMSELNKEQLEQLWRRAKELER